MTSVWATALATALILFNATNTFANEIYITQSGDGLDLNIDQKGENNQVKGLTTTNAPIDGANNTLTINQGYEGNNLIEMSIDGNNNNLTVNQERSNTGGYDTNSYGHHEVVADIAGDFNSVNITQRNNNDSTVGHRSEVVVLGGNNNTVSTLQTGSGGGGTIGHESSVWIRSERDDNTVDIFQNSDVADHRSVISVYSDGNNIDVNQTGNTQNNAYVLFSGNSVGPTNFTLNQNGGDTYGNPDGSYATINCGNAGGCIVTVSQ